MKHRVTRLTTLLLPLLAACTAVPLELPSSVSGDDALLARINAEGDRMIVITVDNPPDSMPLTAGTSAGRYGAAPGYAVNGGARATVTAIAREYGLQEVTAWPIPDLKVHCAVLEVVEGVSRDVIVAKLAKDRRVHVAQALQSFHTLGMPAPLRVTDPDLVRMEILLRRTA